MYIHIYKLLRKVFWYEESYEILVKLLIYNKFKIFIFNLLKWVYIKHKIIR